MRRLAAISAIAILGSAVAAQANVDSFCRSWNAPGIINPGSAIKFAGAVAMQPDSQVTVLYGDRHGERQYELDAGDTVLQFGLFQGTFGEFYLIKNHGEFLIIDDTNVGGVQLMRDESAPGAFPNETNDFIGVVCQIVEGLDTLIVADIGDFGYEYESLPSYPPRSIEDAIADAGAESLDPDDRRIGDIFETETETERSTEGGENSLAALADAVNNSPRPAPRETPTEDSPTGSPDDPSAYRVCDLLTGKGIDLQASPLAGYRTVAKLATKADLPTYLAIDGVDEVFSADARVDVDGLGEWVPVALPFGIRPQKVDDAQVVPMLMLDAQALKLTGAQPDEQAAEAPVERSAVEPLFRLVVVSDANSMGVSGLEQVGEIISQRYDERLLGIEWTEIGPDGTFNAPQSFDGFADLVAEAATREGEFSTLSAAEFERLMTNFEALLTSPGKPIALVVWVVEGFPLPHEAPGLLANTLKRLNQTGNFGQPDGKIASNWLEVFAGEFNTRYHPSYLEGPVSSLRAGEVRIEEKIDGRNRILQEPEAVATNIEIALRTFNATPQEPTEPAPTADDGVNLAGTVVDARLASEELGIIVKLDEMERLSKSFQATQALWFRTESEGLRLPPMDDRIDILGLAEMRSSSGSGLQDIQALTELVFKRRLASLKRRGDDQAEAVRRWIDDTSLAIEINVSLSPDECSHVLIAAPKMP